MNLFLEQRILQSNDKLKNIFHSILKKEPEDSIPKSFLKKRKISENAIDVFNIGWCPENLKDKLPPEKKFLSGGIICPIISEYGETIAFSRRLPLSKKKLDEINEIKWFNDSYSKTFYLYGLNSSLEEIINKNKVFIVEGQFDVITCYDNGIKNIVGLMGSSLTKEHIIKLSRFTDTFVLMLDADLPGRMASEKSKDLIKSLSINKIKIIDINLEKDNKKYDPDLFVRKFGIEEIIKKSNE